MTYYCEKCGHKMDENEQRCAFCGAVQKHFLDQDYEKKKCKKCGKEIYVNANFCPFCGTDQAILNLNKDLKHDDAQKMGERVNKLESNDPQQTALNEFMQQMQAAGIKIRVVKPEEKNESKKPGLITSTKLLIRDMFKINKRLGVNDFWWGFLGFFMICIGANILILELLPLFKIQATMRLTLSISIASAVVFRLGMVTAIIRRLHDIQLPVWICLLWFIPIAQFVVWWLCMMGPQLDNNPYTFDEKDWKKKQNKL